MNCLLLILILCSCNKGCGSCQNNCGHKEEKPCGCGGRRPEPKMECKTECKTECRTVQEPRMESRSYNPFPAPGTCGCEEKPV